MSKEKAICVGCGKEFMSNEWEACQTFMSVDMALINPHTFIWVPSTPGYEYRLQRRKKEKVMPEVFLGDLVTVKSLKGFVIINPDCIMGLEGIDCEGRKDFFTRDVIVRIVRDGKEIWRRGE